ncbi:MAG: hypothetical protein IJU23_14045, partial [Proteobacteria bacterium]|nr:hypothetical protein [Pseudomonadota bacterium]
ICTLIHKFLKKNYDGFEKNDANFVKEIEQIGKLNIRGQFYIFIDECHRSQAGAMHAAMQRIIPNGIFIGFTGTPITKADKNTANRLSEVIFGRFIHCYKYDKAVKDNVVLRLRYDARLVGLKLSKKEKLDDEIENHLREKYKDLKGVQREYFYRRVAEKIYDDPERLSMIVDDIISDFKPRVTVPNKPIPRLQCGGNAMLAVKDIYRACKYYQTFRDNGFYECAVVASDFGDAKALDRNDDSDSCYKAKTFKELLEYYNPSAQDWKNAQNWMNERWMNEREVYEKYIIEKFKKEPNNLKLLIVVDKLLTGFDAPHCSVLYLDKPMKDHTMFQAICRVNRLDDDSKKWGLIVDYCFQLDPILDAMGRYTGSDINIPGYDPEDLVGMIQLSKDAAYSEFINMLDTLNELCRDLFDERGEIDNDSALAYFLRDGDENSLQHRREDLFQYSKSLIRNYHAMPGELQAEYYNDFKKYARLLQFIQVNLGGCEKHEITSTIHNILHKYIKVDDDIKSLKSLENLTDLAACDSPINVVNKLIEQFKKQLNINDDNDDDSKRHSADIIRGNVGSEIRRRFDTDPEKYRKLSEILEDILNKYEEGQKSLAEMLDGIKNDIIDKLDQVDDIPDLFKSARNPIACDVLYRNLIDVFVPEECEIVVVEIDQIMVEKAQVEWRSDQQKRGYVEECIWEVIEKHGKADEQTLKLVMDLIDKQDAY